MNPGIRLLLLLALTLPAYAADKNKPVDLTGSWKEIRRLDRGGSAVDYADTTYYDFLIGNEYTTQRKNSFMYRGTYKATAGMVDLASRTFQVLDMAAGRMVLKDDAGTYEFVRYDKAAAMAENSSAATSSKRAHLEKGQGPVSMGQLAGHWEVYKRTSSSTMPEVDYTRIIREIDIKRDGKHISGSVWASRDMDSAPSWKIDRYQHNILYCSGKGERQLKVLRCHDGELIIQEGIVTYFFKQFR